MADQEWTVKDLMEALKRFPLEAKVYYEMGPNGPGTMGQAQYVKVWGDDEMGVLLDRINPALSVFGHGSRRSPHSLHSAGLCRTSWATSHTMDFTASSAAANLHHYQCSYDQLLFGSDFESIRWTY